MKNILIIVIIILVGVFGWVYFAKRSSTQVTTTQSTNSVVSGKTIEIKDFKYSPATLTVKAGEKITVIDRDASGHSVTADDGSFDSGVLTKDVPGTITAPTKPGTYAFHCLPHPSIQGTLVVE